MSTTVSPYRIVSVAVPSEPGQPNLPAYFIAEIDESNASYAIPPMPAAHTLEELRGDLEAMLAATYLPVISLYDLRRGEG